jgi:sorbitol/mannitol transport system permease protein
MSTAVDSRAGAGAEAPAPGGSPTLRRAGDWARRAPLLPALIFMIIVTQLPFVGTLVISFMNWNAYYPDDIGFAGLANYVSVVTDVNTRNAIITTVELTVGVVLVFNGLLRGIFGEDAPQPDWISQMPLGSVIAALVWQWTPFMMLIILAGLQGRPLDVIEAARIDGCSAWQIFRYMTFPHLRQYLELGALLGSIYIVQNFDAVFTITSGGLGTANLPYVIYQIFYTAHDYGKASAAGVVVVIGTIIIATFALRTVSSLFREESR